MGPQELDILLRIVAIPLAVSFTLCVGMRFLQRQRGGIALAAQWPAIVAVAVGMLAGQFAYMGGRLPESVRLVEGWQWLQGFALASVVLLPISHIRKSRPWIGEAVRVILFAGFVVMSVRAIAAMERSTALAWMIGAPVVCGAWATALGHYGPRAAGRLWTGILALVVGASAAMLFLLHSARMSFMAGALAASLGGLFFGQLIFSRQRRFVSDAGPDDHAMPAPPPAAGGNFPLLVLSGLFLVHVIYIDDVPLHGPAILLVAPSCALIGLIPTLRRRNETTVAAAQIIGVLAVIAAGLIPVILGYEADPYAGY